MGGFTFAMLMAGNDVVNGVMTPGSFILLTTYFTQLAGPLFNLGMFFREVAQSQVDVEDLYDVFQKKPTIQESPDAKDFVFSKGLIEFKNVSFGHKTPQAAKGEKLVSNDESELIKEGDIRYLFENLDLKLEAGTTNAIVGPSGFGKTSMLPLLFRIYDPQKGQVLIDNQNIKDLTFESFRKHIVVVP